MSLNSRLVTTFYAEGSTTEILEVSRSSTILDLRRSIHAKAREKFQREWGDPAFQPDLQSILITANLHGSDNFTDETVEVGDLCDFEDHIYAVVPSRQHSDSVLAPFAALRPDTLSRPLHDNLRQHKILLGLYEDTLEREKNQREEEREREREKREEERKQEQVQREEERKRERSEREEERKRERAEWEGLLKREKAERERQDIEREAKREEARQRERAEWEEVLKREKAERERQDIEREAKREEERRRERAERQKERAEANQKHEDLLLHLREVEETTMDTVGWLAGDTNMLDRIKLRHLLNIAQEKLALAAELAVDRYGASLAWRDALGPSQDLTTRLATARTLLGRPTIKLDEHTRHFIASSDGMRLVAEHRSCIRDRGDKVAHPVIVPRANFEGPISRHPFPADTPGLKALTNYVCI